MDAYPPLEKRELPEPLPWKSAIGVGIVVVGLAMGTGELILWPHLVTKYGLGLLWLALIGISCQYFINQEVARMALATGEGFFTTSARVIRSSVFFWLFSAILLYMWPAWASAMGTTLSALFGFGDYRIWALVPLVLVLGLTLSGRVAYLMLERSLKITVPTFFVLLVIISFYNLGLDDLRSVWSGITNFGGIPPDIDYNLLLSAIVFSGAGGMLNLCVSLWYRDKQLGMARYVGRITNPITGKAQAVAATGYTFEPTEENMRRWRGWMTYVRIDQGIIFWLLGFITLVLLSVNVYAVLHPLGLVPDNKTIAVVQAHVFGQEWGTLGFKGFLVMAFLMLFSTMWTVMDAMTRIVSDIIYTNARIGPYGRVFGLFKPLTLGGLYYSIIAIAVFAGAGLLFVGSQPMALLMISAVLNGIAMAIYTPFLIYFNNTKLQKPLRPGILTNIAMVAIAAFFLYFAYQVILAQATKFFGLL